MLDPLTNVPLPGVSNKCGESTYLGLRVQAEVVQEWTYYNAAAVLATDTSAPWWTLPHTYYNILVTSY